jgi:hypothetical protein
VADLLLSKLQIFELNDKDLQDIVYLLAAFPAQEGDEPRTIGLGRFQQIVGDDWGWWRTVTLNLERLLHHDDRVRELTPAGATYDPHAQAAVLEDAANAAKKSMRWKLRARVGERKRWYELPEEHEHE